MGQSLSQPLFIDQPTPVIYHLAGPYLHKLDLAGTELGKVRLQDDRSHGFMTYWLAGKHPDPRADVLYVPTGRLGGRYGLAAVRPATLEVLGRYEVDDYIVTAPLVLDQRTPNGGNAAIVGTTTGKTGGLLIVLFDLEQGAEVQAFAQEGDGWLSGSPVPVGAGGFAMGVGRPHPDAPVGNYLVSSRAAGPRTLPEFPAYQPADGAAELRCQVAALPHSPGNSGAIVRLHVEMSGESLEIGPVQVNEPPFFALSGPERPL